MKLHRIIFAVALASLTFYVSGVAAAPPADKSAVEASWREVPSIVQVGQRAMYRIAVRNHSDLPVRVKLSLEGLGSGPFKLQHTYASPSLRGEDIPFGDASYGGVVYIRYWLATIQPHKESTFSVGILIPDWRVLSLPPDYQFVIEPEPFPIHFGYRLEVVGQPGTMYGAACSEYPVNVPDAKCASLGKGGE